MDEQKNIHEDMTWADYKKLPNYEEDRIYFIKDITNISEMIMDLKNDLKILTNLVQAVSG